MPNDPLLKAIDFLRDAYHANKALWHYPLAQIPTQFIPESRQRYLYTTDAQGQKQLIHDRYEFLVFQLLRNQLEAGDIFCRDSIRFRSLEDDLLTDEQWQRKDTLIAESSLSVLKQPIEAHLQSLETELEALLTTVNVTVQVHMQGKCAFMREITQIWRCLTNNNRKILTHDSLF